MKRRCLLGGGWRPRDSSSRPSSPVRWGGGARDRGAEPLQERGLQDGDLSIEFQSDFAATSTYASLVDLINTLTTVTVKPTSASTAADNPLHSVSCLVTELPFIDVSVGDLATFSVSWPMSGPVTITTA